MPDSLQYRFIQSKGKALMIDGVKIEQMDSIPLLKGAVTIRFINAVAGNGVALKADKGGILLSDGKAVRQVNVWSDPNLPPVVTHQVFCPTGFLKIWNIYQVSHHDGAVTSEAWTGNAGMIVQRDHDLKRSYRCSDNRGSFDPIFEFEIICSET